MKQCEIMLGITRQVPDTVDGLEAIRLWQAHEVGSPNALDRLLAYNAQDVLSLELLLAKTYNMSMKQYPITTTIHPPKQPTLSWPV